MEIIKSVKYNEPYESIYKLNIGRSLDEYEAEAAMNKILYEDDIQKRISLLTMLLNGIMIKGPTVNEISGLLNASLGMDNMLNSKKKKINLPNDEVLVGVASSGKKGVKTINITSAACFVAAACGANIAKVCSHSTSSKTGSADFLSICGIDIGIPFDKKVETMAEHHISFFSIEDTTPNFAKVYLPEIPLEEQKAIADYINSEVARIDNALPTFQKKIELLREYRTRLISDVVTGQIDVRDVVIPEYTPEDDTEIDVVDAPDDTEEVAEDAE